MGVVSDTGGTRFWNNLIANASVTGGLHRLQNIDSHPASTWPGEYYEDPHLNNSNLVVVTYFTGDTGNGELTGAIGGTYDVDVVGGTDSNQTASPVCRPTTARPTGPNSTSFKPRNSRALSSRSASCPAHPETTR